MMAAKLLRITAVKEVFKPNVKRVACYNVTLELYWSADTYPRWKRWLGFGCSCASNSER
jgi:hypothetical protein